MVRKSDDKPFMTRRKAEEKETEVIEVIEPTKEEENTSKTVNTNSSESESKKDVETTVNEQSPKKEPKKADKKVNKKKGKNEKTPKKDVQSKRKADTKKNEVNTLLNTPSMDALMKAKDRLTVLWGDIIGAFIDTDGKVCMSVLYEDIEVSIPEAFLFEENTEFAPNYNRLSDEAKLEKRLAFARHTIGSKTPFMVGNIYKNDDGEFVVLGSRTDAMKQLRDIYFLHENTKTPINVNVNDEVDALVLYVGEELLFVLCCGVEYRISYKNASSITPINDCRDYFTSGETIKVRVKKIVKNPDKTVRLKLTARSNISDEERLKKLEKLSIHGSYLGFVDKIKVVNGRTTYTVLLTNPKFAGINVAVKDFYIIDNVPLNKNDRVVVQIISINKENGYANAKAMKV